MDSSITISDMNNAAMQIILHAGDCRNLINEAMEDLLAEKDSTSIEEKLKQAKKEITKAHVIQTEMIQGTINDEEVPSTLLFTHAQDTLMTVNSEVNLVKMMVKMYQKLEGNQHGNS